MFGFAQDDETAALLRRSTAMKEAGDWPAALAALAAAKERMIGSPVHYPAETWCKYPRYLQEAGKFEEAMREFDWLIDDLPRRARKESFMDDPSVTGFGKTSKQAVFNQIVRHGMKAIRAKRLQIEQREKKRQAKLRGA